MARSIYEMCLHEELSLDHFHIIRVAGGWIYTCCFYKTSVFVPWHNEFQQDNAPDTMEGANLHPPTPQGQNAQSSTSPVA